jgi:hypothetical protein
MLSLLFIGLGVYLPIYLTMVVAQHFLPIDVIAATCDEIISLIEKCLLRLKASLPV